MTTPSTKQIEADLIATLAAMQAPNGWPFSGAVFEQVEGYDLRDIEDALEELLIVKTRVCIVIYTGEDIGNTIAGRALQVRRTHTFELLMSDRQWTDRREALTGNATDGVAGVYAMKDYVLETLSGEHTVSNRTLVAIPSGSGELVSLTAQAREQHIGRQAWRQPFAVHGGQFRKSLSREAEQVLNRQQ